MGIPQTLWSQTEVGAIRDPVFEMSPPHWRTTTAEQPPGSPGRSDLHRL
jgi:hypothetical protein